MTLADLEKSIESVRIEFALDWLAAAKTKGMPWEEVEKVLRETDWLRESLVKGLDHNEHLIIKG